MVTVVHAAFPDVHFTVEDVIADQDNVVLRWSATATHKGEFMGIAATNKKVAWSGITIYRMAGAKMVEWWNKSDLATVPQQLR